MVLQLLFIALMLAAPDSPRQQARLTVLDAETARPVRGATATVGDKIVAGSDDHGSIVWQTAFCKAGQLVTVTGPDSTYLPGTVPCPAANGETRMKIATYLGAFSGHWAMNVEQTKASGSLIMVSRTGPPPSVTIGHDAASLFFVRRSRTGEVRRTYALSGAENRNTIPAGSASELEVSTAAWKAPAFVITVVGPDRQTTEVIRWFIQDQWLVEETTKRKPLVASHPTSSVFYERAPQ